MILCTFTGVLCGTRGDGVRRWWSVTQGVALTGSQMRSERRSEGTRGNTKVGQKKRSETKYGCGVWRWCKADGAEHRKSTPFVSSCRDQRLDWCVISAGHTAKRKALTIRQVMCGVWRWCKAGGAEHK